MGGYAASPDSALCASASADFLSELAAAVAFAAFLSGCDRDTQGGPGTSVSTRPTPQESFNRIMDVFRRKVEDQPVGFVVSDGKSNARRFVACRRDIGRANSVTSENTPKHLSIELVYSRGVLRRC